MSVVNPPKRCARPGCPRDVFALVDGLWWCADDATREAERQIAQHVAHEEAGVRLSDELRRYRQRKARERGTDASR